MWKILAKYVKAFHAKVCTYPTQLDKLGNEVPIPQGVADFIIDRKSGRTNEIRLQNNRKEKE
jgi:hypothetical protein